MIDLNHLLIFYYLTWLVYALLNCSSILFWFMRFLFFLVWRLSALLLFAIRWTFSLQNPVLNYLFLLLFSFPSDITFFYTLTLQIYSIVVNNNQYFVNLNSIYWRWYKFTNLQRNLNLQLQVWEKRSIIEEYKQIFSTLQRLRWLLL